VEALAREFEATAWRLRANGTLAPAQVDPLKWIRSSWAV